MVNPAIERALKRIDAIRSEEVARLGDAYSREDKRTVTSASAKIATLNRVEENLQQEGASG